MSGALRAVMPPPDGESPEQRARKVAETARQAAEASARRVAAVERHAVRRDHLRSLTLLPWWWSEEARDKERRLADDRARLLESDRRAARQALFLRFGGPWVKP